ncbi:hypothetical protein FQN55_002227 [Onygenales sp. PD_40]|nr:hypothetical protein FQN55_002227 [Onygenales sp. PD_40]
MSNPPRSLKLIRYRGIYYSELVEFAQDAISNIIEEIPTDSVSYILWLKEQRQECTKKVESLEQRAYTVQSNIRPSTDLQEKLRRFKLSSLPSPLPFVHYPLICTIDLDLQILTTSSNTHFSLRNLPRDPSQSSSSRSSSTSSLNNPTPVFTPELDCDPAGYETAYLSSCLPPTKWVFTDGSVHQSFFTLVFSNFKAGYYDFLLRDFSRWSPDDFVFRELAYAIVSLAAAQVSFRTVQPTHSSLLAQRPGLTMYQPSMPSELALGCHVQGESPGSAPEESMYWFNDVLVCLIPEIPGLRSIYRDKAVWFGCQARKSSFHAILLSLCTVTLVEVTIQDEIPTVKYTEPLALLGNFNPPTENPEDPYQLPLSPDTPEPLRLRPHSPQDKGNAGFIALSNFFAAATLRSLKPVNAGSRGRLPTELYLMILNYTDNVTFRTCSRVSRLFRSYCQLGLRIYSTPLDIIGVGCIQGYLTDISEKHDLVITKVSSPFSFTVQNRTSGESLDWSPREFLSPSITSPRELHLVPVFGQGMRLSESCRATITLVGEA